jgi:hypothetical protein
MKKFRRIYALGFLCLLTLIHDLFFLYMGPKWRVHLTGLSLQNGMRTAKRDIGSETIYYGVLEPNVLFLWCHQS